MSNLHTQNKEIAGRKIINIDSLYKWYLCVCIFYTRGLENLGIDIDPAEGIQKKAHEASRFNDNSVEPTPIAS